MANFVRAKSGGWALNEILTSAQMNALDADHIKAPNFDDGSTHTCAADVTMNGAGTIVIGGTKNVKLAARQIFRRHPMSGYILDGTKWTVDNNFTFVNAAVSTTTLVIALTRLAHGAELREVYLRWKGAAGHGALPTLPTFTLYSVDTAGVRANLGTGTDASANVAAYEAAHDIALTALAVSVDLSEGASGRHYFLEVASEQGGNFVANARAIGLRTMQNVASYTEY